jgi:hypothetical protein
MCIHDVEIKPGAKWSSGEFWLTPHRNGWAKGIEPFREYVRKNVKRRWPVPKHVRDGLGYRSVWMCKNQPNDPRDAVWRFADLPKLAAEAKDHGLTEMVLWSWHRPFVLPFPPPFPHLGTEQELLDAAMECRKLGVNLTLFVSVLQADKTTAPNYGLTVTPGSGNWTYHPEMVPRFTPPYASNLACVAVPTNNPKWQEDVASSCKRLIDLGLASICWDQYIISPERPNIQTLTSRVRAMAKQKDPESTFSAEVLWTMETDGNYLDYTWNWGSYRNVQPLTSVLPAPRVNVNINGSPEVVKLCFADNLYMNVWPRKADSINGSDLIANRPELSAALKQCATLRARFLRYFTEGTLIGNCILSEPCSGAHVAAYVLPKSMLVIAINRGAEQSLRLNCDLGPWLASPTGKYAVTCHYVDGSPRTLGPASGRQWHHRTEPLQPLETVLFEMAPD